MRLLTAELVKRLPPLHSQEAEEEPWVSACFFLPGTKWRWFVLEGEPLADDFIFFGFVTGLANEFGRFLLSELEALVSSHLSNWTMSLLKANSPMLYLRPICDAQL